MRYLFIILILISLTLFSYSKLFADTLMISHLRRNGGWLFMDRLTFDKGTSTIRFKIKIQSASEFQREQYETQLAIIPDLIWNEENDEKCRSTNKLAEQNRIEIIMRKYQNYQKQIYHQLIVNQSTTYHFVFRDCKRLITNQYLSREAQIILELHLLNGGYQYGSDEYFNMYFLPLQLIIAAYMIYLTKGPKHGAQIGQQKDMVKFFFFISLVLNFVTTLFYYIGFLIYMNCGIYYGTFDTLYLLSHSIAQSVLTAVIILISFGWSLTFAGDTDLYLFYVPLVSMLSFLDLTLTIMCKINDGDANKYHMYDTIPSYLLAFFKTMTGIIFMGTMALLYRKTIKNLQMGKFLISLFVVGIIYILSLPIIMIFIGFIPQAQRKQLVFFIVEWVKIMMNGYLTGMIVIKWSWYARVRCSKQSFFQSGNKLL